MVDILNSPRNEVYMCHTVLHRCPHAELRVFTEKCLEYAVPIPRLAVSFLGISRRVQVFGLHSNSFLQLSDHPNVLIWVGLSYWPA
jgi:hypothetical protein